MEKKTSMRVISLAVIIGAGLVVNDITVHKPLILAQTARQAPPQKQAETLEARLYQAAAKEGQLNWWDSLSLVEANEWIKAFTNRYPGIKVTYFEASQDRLCEKYLNEYKAGKASADILPIEPLAPFKEQKLLADLGDIIKDVQYPYHLKDYTAVTIEQTIWCSSYNTNKVAAQEVPKSWDDLLDPKWKGKIALENRFKPFIYITESVGEEWVVNFLKRLRGQGLIFTGGGTASATLLSAGEFSILIGNHLHRTLIMAGKGQPVAFLPISPVGHNAVSPTAVPKTAPHPNVAKLFMRWMIGPEGQALVEKVRMKGSPVRGSGTAQSKILEEQGTKIVSTTEWVLDNLNRLEILYGDAVGFLKKK